MTWASKRIVKRKQLSGAKKAKAYGKKVVMVLLSQDEYERIAQAAELECRPVSAFMRYHALCQAPLGLGNPVVPTKGGKPCKAK